MSGGKALCERCTDVIVVKRVANSKSSPKKRVEHYCADCASDRRESTKLWNANEEVKIAKETGLTDVPEDVKLLYSVLKRHSGQLGGDLYGGEIYGEMTIGSFQRIIDFLVRHCEFGARSVFLDIGSGLGKPNAHVALYPGVKYSLGLELMDLRWQLSLHNLRYALQETSLSQRDKCTVFYGKADACDLATFNPCTHLYMFDVGFVRETLNRLAKIFNQSASSKYLVSSKKPRDVIFEYGFLVKHIGSMAISMTSSNESHAIYVYEALPKLKRQPSTKLVPSSEKKQLPSPKLHPKRGSVPTTSSSDSDETEKEVDSVPTTSTPSKPSIHQPAHAVLQDGIDKMQVMNQTEYMKWIGDCLNATLFKEGHQTRSRSSKRRRLFD